METNQHRLLLVEDDTSLGYLLSEYLKMKGMEVVWVQRAAEVLPLLEAQVFDLLILDVMMPDLDGFSLGNKSTSGSPPSLSFFSRLNP